MLLTLDLIETGMNVVRPLQPHTLISNNNMMDAQTCDMGRTLNIESWNDV
jgi:hypothetical protein